MAIVIPPAVHAAPVELLRARDLTAEEAKTDCSICLQPFQEPIAAHQVRSNNNEIIKHLFCQQCLVQFYKNTGSVICPFDRAPLDPRSFVPLKDRMAVLCRQLPMLITTITGVLAVLSISGTTMAIMLSHQRRLIESDPAAATNPKNWVDRLSVMEAATSVFTVYLAPRFQGNILVQTLIIPIILNNLEELAADTFILFGMARVSRILWNIARIADLTDILIRRIMR